MSALTISIPPKFTGETVSIDFDFASRMSVDDTISSASVTCSVYSGTDASPSSMVSGSADIDGTVVSQLITAGTEGVMYSLKCTANLASGVVLQMSGFLAVVPPAV